MENYEKKYNKLKNSVQHLYESINAEWKSVLKSYIPELKESEGENADEKVRKALIKLVTNHASMDLFIEYDIHLDEAIAWLEKQGEQKEATCVAEIIDRLTEKEQEILFKELEMQKVQNPVWSEEDEMMLECILNKIGDHGTGAMYKKWMNSLKERYTWKPNEKQIEAFEFLVRSWGESGTLSPYGNTMTYITSLLNDLKQLKTL